LSARIEDLTQNVVRIREERDWGRFHTPKNIAISLSVESAELLEIFTWKTDEESKNLNETELSKVKAEVGDILFNLVNISQTLNIDLLQSGFDKIKEIEEKYASSKFKGSSKKYNED
jgi:dCTP diphosphatase